MAFYFVTGKLGNGKSLVSVSRIKDKIQQGCRIATNIDLDLVAMFGPTARNVDVIRVPDRPTIYDLNVIGNGNETYDEAKNGLLVLDECGSWFNSRNWQSKGRAEVNDWFRHARKLGWDCILIVHDISLIDNQAREALSEHVAFCKRMDNFRVPLVGGLYKTITGSRLKLPKMHVARVVYGAAPTDPLSDRWVYRGTDLYKAYDTKQIFREDYPHGPHSLLTPWHLTRHYRAKRNWDFYMRITKIYFKKLKSPLAIFSGIVFGVLSSYGMTLYANDQFYKDYERLQHEIKNREVPASVPVDSDSENEELARFEGWKIVGFSDYSGSIYYDLEPPMKDNRIGPDEKMPTVSTSELLSFNIQPLTPCHLRIHYQSMFKDVYCF